MGQKVYIDLKDEVSKSLIFKSIKIIFGLLSIILISRFLSLSQLGQYFIAVTFIEVTNQVCSGLDAAVQKRCSEKDGNNGEILVSSLLLYIIYLIVLFPVLYLTKGILFDIISIEVSLFIPVYLGVVSVGIFRISNNYLSGIGFPSRSVAVVSAKNFLAFILHLYFLITGMGIYYLVLTEFIVAALASSFILLHKKPQIAFSFDTMKNVIDFSKWSIPNSILSILTHRVDVFILAAFVGASSVGIYQAAYKIFLPTIMIATSLSNPLFVKISNLHSKGMSFKEKSSRVISYAGILTIPLVFGSFLLRDNVMILIYGPKFTGTSLIVILISFYILISVYRRQFISIFYGINKPDTVFKIQSMYFLINTPLSIYGAIKYGIVGVVIMTLISEILTLIIYYYLQRKNIKLYTFRKILKQFYSSIIMSGLILPIIILIHDSPSYYFIPVILLGGLVYFISLLKFLPEFRYAIYDKIKNLNQIK